MPVLTRQMRKSAGLPDLPARFPVDVPNVATRPPPSKNAPSKRRPESVARSTLPLASPSVLSSPTRFDAPSPLTSFDSAASSQRSRSHSVASSSSLYSTTSTATQLADPLSGVGMHPGVRRLQRTADARWTFLKDGETVRMCGPPVDDRHRVFGNEWGGLGAQVTYVAANRSGSGSGSRASSIHPPLSPEETIRGTPLSSRVSPFVGRPDKELRVPRRQAGMGVPQR